MSRLRRMVLSERFFLVTCRVQGPRGKMREAEFAVLAEVVRKRRKARRLLRTVTEHNEKLEYIHWNPVRAGLVRRPEDWKWSSVHAYTGSVTRAVWQRQPDRGGAHHDAE